MSDRFNLRAGTIINTVRANIHGAEIWPVEPSFTVPEDGFYRAIVNTSNGTASIERVPEPNRWAAFTDDELLAIDDHWHPKFAGIVAEIKAELERRKT